MWHIIIFIVLLNMLHSVFANAFNFRPVIYMTDLQKTNVVRNGPESRPIQYMAPKTMCGPNYSCEQRQPICNYSMHGILHNNQDQYCNSARRPPPAAGRPPPGAPPIYRVPQYHRDVSPGYPPALRNNPVRYYKSPPQQHPQYPQSVQQSQQYKANNNPQYMRGYGYQNYQTQARYIPGRIISQSDLYYKVRDNSYYMNRMTTLSTFHVQYMSQHTRSRGTGTTTSTWAPNTVQSTHRNRWGTTSTQAPFPGGMTLSLDTPAQNKCGQFAVCYMPTWNEKTVTTSVAKLRTKEEMDPDLMKYIMPRH